ncbi:hypothetical protein PS870_06439 [Pseudomonas fluorescens]|uniref:Uncharacterized protein n=1 Tax=Pseudomonas fluorescens TaxID=294 RepID=A0A5E7QS86_PSEFL|nr:hypothetical protein [Pseudomonas fluorescens]VVP61763.1 hypothetical protein PS870_06439 [Pseudomonas fluorescens]
MTDRCLAAPDLNQYRYAVFCCSFKIDLGSTPDHALALFADEGMAMRYGAGMWPTTFQVVDLHAVREVGP